MAEARPLIMAAILPLVRHQAMLVISPWAGRWILTFESGSSGAYKCCCAVSVRRIVRGVAVWAMLSGVGHQRYRSRQSAGSTTCESFVMLSAWEKS